MWVVLNADFLNHKTAFESKEGQPDETFTLRVTYYIER
jgi:hypothetical protein